MDHAHHMHHHHQEASASLGPDVHAGHQTHDFLTKFWVVAILTVPLIAYSDLPHALLGITAPSFPGVAYMQLILGSVVFWYGGMVFLHGAVRELRARLPGMMTLIALAISAAYFYSVSSVLVGMGMTLFWELSTLIAIMLLGHWVEMKAIQRAQGALRELAQLLPDTAEVLRDGTLITLPLNELQERDVVLVRPGGKFPADGLVVKGTTEVNESLITGESAPVIKNVGSEVIAGSINGDGSVEVRIERIGEATFLAGVMRLVAEAEASKSRLQLLSDRAARYLTFLAVIAGLVTFGAWMYVGAGFAIAIERLVSVLVITCPHALGLAIPLVASISATLAARNGFFIKRRSALESARSITTVLFDKTGTLTEGTFSVVSASDEALTYAAAVEIYSEHPIGKAIVAEAHTRHLSIVQAEQFQRLPGVGAEAFVAGTRVFVGHRNGTDIVVEVDGISLGSIVLADTIRAEAREAVAQLQAMGITVGMITGDSQEVAADVAKQLGITEFFARVRPEEKAQKVAYVQSQGGKVAMVGDGINDAPALAQADVGIAIGAGTTVAIESAGIILVKNDPRDIPKIIRLSRFTYTKMIQNLFWATGYNIIALPVAAGALMTYGITLQPAVAAVLMSLSTVVVAVNAALLKRVHIYTP